MPNHTGFSVLVGVGRCFFMDNDFNTRWKNGESWFLDNMEFKPWLPVVTDLKII